jgi:diaminohydroxyphosphoribosylaminopyrimidine deaminase/5-amino-6-(5-phosphoribosylamino)uracil reductase
VLHSLYGDGVTRVMVEGGPTVSAAFLEAGLVDEAVIARGTEALGGRGRKPLGSFGLEVFEDAARWRQVERRAIGADCLYTYRPAGPGSGP